MLSSGITTIVFGKDGLTITYCLQKPWGTPDLEEEKFISYDSVSRLPAKPQIVDGDMNWEHEIHIPRLNATVVFVFHSFQERSGPNEHNISGPYLKSPK